MTSPGIGDLRDAIARRANELAVDALFSEKGQYADAATWRRVHYFLGGSSTLAAACAGGAFLQENPSGWIPAGLAFVAATTSALMTFLKPDEQATRHHRSGVAYRALRRELQHFVHVDLARADLSEANLAEQQKGFDARYGEIQKEAAPTSGAAYAKAKKQIAAGEADYTAAELVAAVGHRVASV